MINDMTVRGLARSTMASYLRSVTRLARHYRRSPDQISARMYLRVDQGKGDKDRYVPLSPRLLELLRQYWRHRRPQRWLFPTPPLDRPMSRQTPARIYHAAKEKARIRKPGGIHTLRHYSRIRLIR